MAEQLLDKETREQLQKFFEDMDNVKVVLVMDKNRPTCQLCDQIEQLLKELKETAPDKIQLEVYTPDSPHYDQALQQYNLKHVPAIVIVGKNNGMVRYLGIPSGHEFGAFVETIKEMSLGHVHLPEEIIEEVRKIDKPVHIQVFVTPTCPYCPMAAVTSYHFAAINPNITSDVIEAVEFPDLANKYRVNAVPAIVINDKVRFEGAYPPDAFLQKIKEAL